MALVLDLLRHGQALPAGPDGDRQRELSPAGTQGLLALAARLAREAWRPDRVFASPFLRARRSAEIVLAAAGAKAAVEALPELESEHSPAEVLAALAARGATAGHVLLVGHQPLLGLLVGHLTGLERGFAPGTLVRVHFAAEPDAGAGRVALSLSPEDPGPA